MSGYFGAAPSWEAAARIYVAAIEAGPSDGADAAREEIIRLARLYEVASEQNSAMAKALIEIEKLAGDRHDIKCVIQGAM
jgi:hypothetical protein